jgi:hypothetical protein
MKYTKTIFCSLAVIEKIIDGTIKLQTGQWIKLYKNDPPSRFVGVTNSGSIWALHPNGKTVSRDRFSKMCQNYKCRK